MVRLSGGLLLLSTILATATPTFRDSPSPAQLVLDANKRTERQQVGNSRKLKGRFLHITDFHPDPYYKIGATPKAPHPCHQGEDNTLAGFYGAPATKCDSPFTLVEATFRWIKENVKDEIDFVIWTGDSARHDNDKDIPRSDDQVLQLNKYIADKFVEVFANTDDPNSVNKFIIPIVPTLGNNDILPHNIFMPGPNRWSEEFADIWEQFIPQDQVHSFARGGWFSIEVIPDKLAVINLNTLYFFSSNAAVDGCELESEPGYEHFEWLRVQLQDFRERGMKAYLIGHVPPARTKSKKSWDETCYQKYILWHKQFRDVIIASFYGHMNIDHFMFHDTQDLLYETDINQTRVESIDYDGSVDMSADTKFHIKGKAKYLNQLRDNWSDLPTPPRGMTYDMSAETDVTIQKRTKHVKRFLREIGGPYAERFTMSMVSPSVVPNYFPTLRLIEYNITGLENEQPAMVVQISKKDGRPSSSIRQDSRIDSSEHERQEFEDNIEAKGRKKHKKHGKHGRKKPKWPRKPNFRIPDPPSRTSIPGPAHFPQTLSLVSWTQMYANLTEIHERMVEDGISPSDLASQDAPRDLYKYFEYKVEYKTDKDDVYDLPDLTVRSWLSLAERIGRSVYQPIELDLTHNAQNTTSTLDDHVHDETEREDDDEDEEDEDEDDEGEEMEEEEEEEDDDDDLEDDVLEDGVGTNKHGKHKKHKKHRKHKKHKHRGSGQLKANRLWHDFVQRAYVGAKQEKYLRKHFD